MNSLKTRANAAEDRFASSTVGLARKGSNEGTESMKELSVPEFVAVLCKCLFVFRIKCMVWGRLDQKSGLILGAAE